MSATTLGIGVLSWHGYETLRATLQTYQRPGFLDLFDERVIFLPEITDKGRALAADFGFSAKGQSDNKGIMDGFRGLAQSMESNTVVLLENDCPLIVAPDEAARQITTAQALITNKTAHVVRLRSRADPGECFETTDKYKKLYPPDTASNKQKALAKLVRVLRPGKARRLIGTSVYVEDDPAGKFPGQIARSENGFYLAPTSVINWTNQSIMIERDFFLDQIIARAESVNGRRTVNGFKNLEIELNDSWWRSRPWTVAIAPGLFTHRRLGSRGY